MDGNRLNLINELSVLRNEANKFDQNLKQYEKCDPEKLEKAKKD